MSILIAIVSKLYYPCNEQDLFFTLLTDFSEILVEKFCHNLQNYEAGVYYTSALFQSKNKG